MYRKSNSVTMIDLKLIEHELCIYIDIANKSINYKGTTIFDVT